MDSFPHFVICMQVESMVKLLVAAESTTAPHALIDTNCGNNKNKVKKKRGGAVG
jgi:hypothetical protein